MANDTKWLRKATAVEEGMEQMGHQGTLLVTYRLSVSARRLLQPEEVEQALAHLYRKSPNLRSCLASRDGQRWFKEMEKQTIDFEVSSADVDEITDYMHSQGYPEDGPQWRARLLPVSTPLYQPQHLSSFHEDLKETFPYCYHIVFGFSHAIGDGHSFIRICLAFAHILDQVLSGEEVDEEQQICCFALNEEYDRKAEECISRFYTDEKLREESIREAITGKPDFPILHNVLSLSEEGPKRTVLYNQTLDKPTTARLQEKCRAMKVTLSSCMAAVGNLALVDMLVEKGVIQDTYSISNSHLVNMRRVWPKGTTEKAFGCYFSTTPSQFLETPRTVNDDEQFWEYAKRVHKRFYGLLNDEKFIEKIGFISWCYYTNKMDYIERDLTYNTRGDLTLRFEGTKEITVTNLLSSSSIHGTDIPWDHVFGTVRGRLTHTIKYNTGMISKVTAVRYSDLVYARLLKVTGK